MEAGLALALFTVYVPFALVISQNKFESDEGSGKRQARGSFIGQRETGVGVARSCLPPVPIDLMTEVSPCPSCMVLVGPP